MLNSMIEPYMGEVLQGAVKEYLESALPIALASVADYWDDSSVSLASPVSWFCGHNPAVIDLESTDFPFVSVVCGGRQPGESASDWGCQGESFIILIDFYVVAETKEVVNLAVQRYAQAICLALRGQRSFNGYAQRDLRPEVKISEAAFHSKSAHATTLNNEDVDFIQQGRVTVVLE